MAAAADAESLDDLFLRLEAAGVMLRIDTDVMPTMAKTPTLGTWELDLLRTIENVVRLGHIKHVTRREIVLDDGVGSAGAGLARGALRRLRTAVPTAGSRLGAGQDPTPDDPGRLPVLQRGAGRLRGGNPRRRPRAQPVVSAQHPPRPPGRLGADAGSWNRRHPHATARSRTSPPGRTAAPSTPRASSRRNATILRCRPLPHVWPTSPSAGSREWPNSHTSRCRASTRCEASATARRERASFERVAGGAVILLTSGAQPSSDTPSDPRDLSACTRGSTFGTIDLRRPPGLRLVVALGHPVPRSACCARCRATSRRLSTTTMRSTRRRPTESADGRRGSGHDSERPTRRATRWRRAFLPPRPASARTRSYCGAVPSRRPRRSLREQAVVATMRRERRRSRRRIRRVSILPLFRLATRPLDAKCT